MKLKGKKLIIVAIVGAIGLILNQFGGYNLAYIGGNTIQGTITKIADGDTLTLLHNDKKLKIRFYGIDAPESTQSFGEQSKKHLLSLCPLHSSAKVQIKERDKYNRIVGIVFCNGIDVNAKQVESGLAWAYKEYSLAYWHLEIRARMESRGLWSESHPIKPSIYRQQSKNKAQGA